MGELTDGQPDSDALMQPSPVAGQLLFGGSRSGSKSAATKVEYSALKARMHDTRQFVNDLRSFQVNGPEMEQAIRVTMDLLRGRIRGNEGFYANKYSWRVVIMTEGSEDQPTRREVLQATRWFQYKEQEGDTTLDRTRPSWDKHMIVIDPEQPDAAWSVFEEEMERLRVALRPKSLGGGP